jgi:hypothetical protein
MFLGFNRKEGSEICLTTIGHPSIYTKKIFWPMVSITLKRGTSRIQKALIE